VQNILENNILTCINFNLVLLHVEPEAQAKHELIFNRQPLFLYFSCLFGVFTMSTSYFFGKFIFFVLQNEN